MPPWPASLMVSGFCALLPLWHLISLSHSRLPRPSMASLLSSHPPCGSFSFESSVCSTSPHFPVGSQAPFLSQPRNVRHSSLPFSSRRLIIPSISAIWDAITGRNSHAREAVAAVRRGMLLFRQGDVLGSVSEFDKAIELEPRQKAYLWQRGLSLYYLDRFEEGAEQFRLDVAMNPNDTEESIWCFLCEARLYGVDGARKQFLEVGRDPRPVMRKAYDMFKDGGNPEKIVEAFQHGQDSEYFYACLYAGLYCEAENESDRARFHMVAACQSPYGQRSDDYMASLARVHCLCRNWSLT